MKNISNNINKVALITGSKEGIGYQTALQLASRNWTLLLADKQELEQIKEKIIKKTSNKRIFTYYVDLGSFKSVRKFADVIKSSQDRMDVLINNAGIFEANERRTVDNINPVMQVNYLGPFLLTNLLTDLLKKSSPSRIIFLASSGAFLHNLDTNTLPVLEAQQSLNILQPTFTYYNSKLCNMIMAKQFAKRFEKYNVTSNCLHPGMTNSSFLLQSNTIKFVSPIAYKLIQLVTQDVEESAAMVTFLATSETVSQTTGKYFVNYQVHRMPKIVEDCDYCNKIWEQAEKLTKLTKKEREL